MYCHHVCVHYRLLPVILLRKQERKNMWRKEQKRKRRRLSRKKRKWMIWSVQDRKVEQLPTATNRYHLSENLRVTCQKQRQTPTYYLLSKLNIFSNENPIFFLKYTEMCLFCHRRILKVRWRRTNSMMVWNNNRQPGIRQELKSQSKTRQSQSSQSKTRTAWSSGVWPSTRQRRATKRRTRKGKENIVSLTYPYYCNAFMSHYVEKMLRYVVDGNNLKYSSPNLSGWMFFIDSLLLMIISKLVHIH